MQEQNENGCHFDAARRGTGTASDEHQDNGKQFATLCERANIKCIKTGSSWCNHTEKRTADDAFASSRNESFLNLSTFIENSFFS